MQSFRAYLYVDFMLIFKCYFPVELTDSQQTALAMLPHITQDNSIQFKYVVLHVRGSFNILFLNRFVKQIETIDLRFPTVSMIK